MMAIPVFGETAIDRSRIARAMAPTDHEMFADSEAMLVRAHDADVAVWGISGSSNAFIPTIRTLCLARPQLQLLLIIAPSFDRLRRLATLPPHHVIFWDELSELGDICPSLVRHVWHNQMADFVDVSAMPGLLRTALQMMLSSLDSCPYRSVAELGRAVHCSPITVSQYFRRAHGRITLHEAIDWLQVVWACTRRPTAGSWARVADELGIHYTTLQRKMHRCMARRPAAAPDVREVQHLAWTVVFKPLGIAAPDRMRGEQAG